MLLFDAVAQAALRCEPARKLGVHIRRVDEKRLRRGCGNFACRFGVAKQSTRIATMRRMQRNARFGGHAEARAFERDRRVECLGEDALGSLRRFSFGPQARHEQPECIRPDACRRLACRRGGAQTLGDRAQRFIACGRPVRVVHRAEMLDIGHHDCELGVAAPRIARVHRNALEKANAIRQSGQRIVMRKVFGLHRLVDECHAERDIGPEFFEQLDFVGAEEAGTRRVQHEDADRIPVDAQRKCRCGTITAGEAFVADHTWRVVRFDVVVDGRAIVDDCGRRHSSSSRRIAIEHHAHVRQKAALIAGVREHRDRVVRRAAQSHPRHSERAFRNRDTTRFLEQLGAVANANDRGIDCAQERVTAIHSCDARLRRFPLANVARDPGNAGELAGCAIQRPARHGDADGFTVLAVEDRFRRFGGECGSQVGSRQRTAFAEQPIDAMADRLRGREAQHALRTGAPVGDFAIQRVRDDGVVNSVDDRGQRIIESVAGLSAGERSSAR